MRNRMFAFFVLCLLVLSSFGVSAQETDDAGADSAFDSTTETEIIFDADVAGETPNHPIRYWFDTVFTGRDTKEAINELGLMVEAGDYESARVAMENFEEAVTKETKTLETASLDGVTIDILGTHAGAQTVEDAQINVLEYEIYTDAIEEILDEQVGNGIVTKEETEIIVDDLNQPVNEIGAVVEARTQELYDAAGGNSGVSEQEVVLSWEDKFIRDRTGGRFEEIASIQDVLELEEKIAQLEQEIAEREAAGDTEGLAEVRTLLDMARSHGENCLNSEENNQEIEGVNHINAGEDIVDKVEKYLLTTDPETTSAGQIDCAVMFCFEGQTCVQGQGCVGEITLIENIEEQIEEQIVDDNEDATKFIEDYETLKERYADNPERLAYIELENKRAQNVQALTQKLFDEGVMDKWFEELRAEGLSEEDVIAQVHERFVNEYEAVNGHDVPPGLYRLPGDDGVPGTGEEILTEGGPNPEVIGIGRIEIVETIDPETGEVKKEIIGWWDGDAVENVEAGGGYPLGVPIPYPDGNTVTFGAIGYTVTTPAGVVIPINYPEGYIPTDHFDYGDEAVAYETEDGNIVTFSTTGYEIEDAETGEVVAGEAYTQEIVTFADGSRLDNEATGYVFNDGDGEAYVYAYNPTTGSYIDTTAGKVYIPQTSAPHAVATVYDPAAGTYTYTYNGVPWTTDGSGRWSSSTGQQINLRTVPAPVGYEQDGTYTTPSGEIWNFNPETNTWTNSAGDSYAVAPNNLLRPDPTTGFMTDSRGNTVAPVGTTVNINGETYTVTADRGWTNAQGQAVAPPYDSATGRQYPSSAAGYYRDSVSGGQGSYVSPWSYNAGTGQWVSSETGDMYDQSTGTITHPDGTVSRPEDRPAGEGSEGVPPCYGCYYQGGEGTSGEGGQWRDYNFAGGHYEQTPGGYGYVDNQGVYQGPDVIQGANGEGVWRRQEDGTYDLERADGSIVTAEEYAAQYGGSSGSGFGYSGGYGGNFQGGYGYSYSGGGGYSLNPDGTTTYVGGSYGNYDSSGQYTGGATWNQNPDGTWTNPSTGEWSGSSSGSYSGPSYSPDGSGGYTGGTGGTSGGSYGGYTGGTTGDSTGGTTGGDTGGSAPSGGGDSGGGSTGGDGGGGAGYVVKEIPKMGALGRIVEWFRNLFGN